MNAGNKNTPSTHHPRRRNVTTLMVGLKKRSHTQKSHSKVVNPRDIAGEKKQLIFGNNQKISVRLNGLSCCYFRHMQVPCSNFKQKCTHTESNVIMAHSCLLLILLNPSGISYRDHITPRYLVQRSHNRNHLGISYRDHITVTTSESRTEIT